MMLRRTSKGKPDIAMSKKTLSHTVSRRALLKSTGAGAVMAAVGAEFPFGVHIAQAAGPEGQPEPGAAGEPAGSPPKDDVVEADYEIVDEKK